MLDPGGAVLPGGCFALFRDSYSTSSSQQRCDSADGATDGVTHFSVTSGGRWYFRPSSMPAGPYAWAGRISVSVVMTSPGVAADYRLQNERTATVTNVDASGLLVLRGCLQAFQNSADINVKYCDQSDNVVDGVIHLSHLPGTGTVWVRSSTVDSPPTGYQRGGQMALAFDATGHADATYVWPRTP
jgi:hypothetical protein